MHILSDYEQDIKTPDKAPGGYEWWYFDAYDKVNDLGLVIIFYDGNPFSTKYLEDLNNKPDEYPAISISAYKDGRPIYYSFTETNWLNAAFDEKNPKGNVNKHAFESYEKEGKLIYELELNEVLASGDSIIANLTFSSSSFLNVISDKNGAENHTWNLVQPKADVKGMVKVNKDTYQVHGQGYHDHNIGQERMEDSFKDWYWGRFHFEEYTFIYYVMNKLEERNYKGWLIDNTSHSITDSFDTADLEYYKRNFFGISSARKITFKSANSNILVQASKMLDNGPFYQRFMADAIIETDSKIYSARGISEYIMPSRISKKIFWPLVHMRIRYDMQKPHWVQRSKMLYRWTW